MNKKIIVILSTLILIGGAFYLGKQGGFGSLSSSAVGGGSECSEASQSAGEARYTQSTEAISNISKQITKIQDNMKERQENKEKNRNDAEEIRKDIKTLQSTVKKLNGDIQKDCAGVTKRVQPSGRGGSIENPAYGKCENRKKEVQTTQTKIQTLQTTLKNKNETLEKITDAQKEAQKSIREFERRLKDHIEYRESYEECKSTLAQTPTTGTQSDDTDTTKNTASNTTATNETNDTNITGASTTGIDTIDDSDEDGYMFTSTNQPIVNTTAVTDTTVAATTNNVTWANERVKSCTEVKEVIKNADEGIKNGKYVESKLLGARKNIKNLKLVLNTLSEAGLASTVSVKPSIVEYNKQKRPYLVPTLNMVIQTDHASLVKIVKQSKKELKKHENVYYDSDCVANLVKCSGGGASGPSCKTVPHKWGKLPPSCNTWLKSMEAWDLLLEISENKLNMPIKERTELINKAMRHNSVRLKGWQEISIYYTELFEKQRCT